MKILGGHDRLPSVDATLRSGRCAVVKLGGGLITSDNKGHPVTNRALITACAQGLVNSSMPIVLVHGTGSYGKPGTDGGPGTNGVAGPNGTPGAVTAGFFQPGSQAGNGTSGTDGSGGGGDGGNGCSGSTKVSRRFSTR